MTITAVHANEPAPAQAPASPASTPTGAPAADQAETAAPADGVTQLPGVTIERKRRNIFEESDRKLRELIDGATPCLGCDVKKPDVSPSFLKQVIDGASALVTPQSSQPLNHDDDTQNEVDRADYERRHPSNSKP